MKLVKNQKPAKKPNKPQHTLYQLKIRLLDSPLPIWRRVVIRADAPLLLVHEIIQISMGWWNTHLYEFQSDGRRFGDVDLKEANKALEDDTKFHLNDLLENIGDRFQYIYDHGDDWRHEVVLEHVLITEEEFGLAACIVGRRACPPEDVGGPEGYRMFLDVIEDPQHDDRINQLEWAGGDFDPNSFDIRGVNLRLLQLHEELLDAALTE
ncbi:MAG TPA: plasmid pRiA4b ORF-3 family protein [Planktothrix sp.]|jgi:hypothetical protein